MCHLRLLVVIKKWKKRIVVKKASNAGKDRHFYLGCKNRTLKKKTSGFGQVLLLFWLENVRYREGAFPSSIYVSSPKYDVILLISLTVRFEKAHGNTSSILNPTTLPISINPCPNALPTSPAPRKAATAALGVIRSHRISLSFRAWRISVVGHSKTIRG